MQGLLLPRLSPMPLRYLYTLIFYLILPFILLRLLWRAKKNPAYAQRLSERFGFLPSAVTQGGIWIHAVSVGESLAAVPLIKKLRSKYPELAIIVTTTTPTGGDRIQAALKGEVTHFYIPYDLPDALHRFLNAVQPQLAIIMETELWPNLFHLCNQRNIPLFIANARLSAKSANGYKRIAPITRELLQNITVLAVQTQIEADRFISLGLDPSRIQITGSIKFDLEIPADLITRAAHLREQWGKDRLIWIAASTHEGEEEQILQAYSHISKRIPHVLLVLVPRHPERFARVTALCERSGYSVVLRSQDKECSPSTQIFIGDSMGELLLFYAASDVAFVGGSLVATGGHNPLEPAALNLPIVMGPHVFNFATICNQLQEMQALCIVQNAKQLEEEVLSLLQDENQRQQKGQRGREFVAQNRGALEKHLVLIESLLKR